MRVDHTLGFSLSLPAGWRVISDPSPEVLIVGYAPPDATGFSRNVTVSGGLCPPAWHDPAAWQEASVRGLWEILEEPQLLDAVCDGDSVRQLISYVKDQRCLTVEQWMLTWQKQNELYSVTISFTTPTLQYGRYADEATAIAGSWRPDPHGASQ